VGIAYHLRGREQPVDVLVEQTGLERGDFWAQECPDAADCLGDPPRIWVLSISFSGEDVFEIMEDDKAAALRRDYVVSQQWGPSGIYVDLMVRRANR
jgi:mannosyltransferase